MELRGVTGHHKRLRNFLVGQPVGEQSQHLSLPIAQQAAWGPSVGHTSRRRDDCEDGQRLVDDLVQGQPSPLRGRPIEHLLAECRAHGVNAVSEARRLTDGAHLLAPRIQRPGQAGHAFRLAETWALLDKNRRTVGDGSSVRNRSGKRKALTEQCDRSARVALNERHVG